MRIFFLMCILGASLTIAAQNIIYGNKNEQRAINMAFDILQVYYHSFTFAPGNKFKRIG